MCGAGYALLSLVGSMYLPGLCSKQLIYFITGSSMCVCVISFGKFEDYTPWPNKNASILFGTIFQKLINKNEKLFHDNN